MKHLVKLYLYIIGFFGLIFLFMNLSGLMSVEDIKHYIQTVSNSSPLTIATVIFLLLASDVFFSVPTIFIVTSAGYLLGFWPGFIAATLGMFMSGFIARILCGFSGKKILKWVFNNNEQVSEVHALFQRFGPGVLLISRALPMLPEATCCMSGINKLPWRQFILYYLAGTIPYAAILVYLGSVSNRENPYPAIAGIIGMYMVLWLIWFLLIKRKRH